MSELECPVCERKLRKRAKSVSSNVNRREIPSKYDRYVCPYCKETFSSYEVEPSVSTPDWF